MAETKGITISFYGDTANFDKSVDGINKALKLTQNELKEVNKALKFDPSNTDKLQRQFELLNQKQTLLKESINTYKQELEKLGNYDDLNEDQKKQWESLQKSIAKAENELQYVNKQLDNLKGKDLRDLSKQLGEIEKSLDKASKTVENVAKKFMVLTGAITGLATTGVLYNAELERQTALFTGLTGSAEEAQKVLSSIKQDAITSPFDTQSLISANQYLMASGIEADKARETINALGNAIASTGGGNSELQRMAQNLQQIQNVGKASTMDLRQFAMAGIDIWGILSESTGKTVKQLQNMTITYDMLSEALIKASSEGGKYAGAMSAQSDTLNGKINKLKSTFQELLGELTEVLVPAIKNVIDMFQGWIDKLRSLDDEQKKTITKIAGIVASIGPVLMIIAKVLGALKGLVGFVKLITESQAISTFLASVTTAGGGIAGVLSAIGAKIVALINPVTAVIGAFGVLYATSDKFRGAVNNLVSTLKKSLIPIFNTVKKAINEIIKVISTLISNVVKALTPIIQSIIQILVNVINTIGSLATNLLSILRPAINVVISIFTTFITTVSNVVSWLANKLSPAFDLIVKVVRLVSNVVLIMAQNIGEVAVIAFEALETILSNVKDVIKDVIDWIKKLYEKFADTSFGQKFINMFDTIGNVVDSVKETFKSLVGWIDDLLLKTDKVIGKQQVVNSQMSRGGNSWDTMNSGGFGMNVNINVTNNGTPIDTNMVNSWAETIAERVDYVLGRNLT